MGCEREASGLLQLSTSQKHLYNPGSTTLKSCIRRRRHTFSFASARQHLMPMAEAFSTWIVVLNVVVLRAVGPCSGVGLKIAVPENYDGIFPWYLSKLPNLPGEYGNVTVSGDNEGIFGVDSGFLYALKPFDREKQPSYSLQVSFTTGGKTHSFTVEVRVSDKNDNIPKFVEESLRGTVQLGLLKGIPFMKLMATDRDDPDTQHAELRYSLMGQTPRIPSSQMFFVDARSGEVSLTDDGASSLDPEMCGRYRLSVMVKDMAGRPTGFYSTGIVTVEVTGNTWGPPDPVRLQENLPGPYPIPISQVKWSGSPAEYSLEGEFPEMLFTISRDGIIYLNAPLDRETQDQFHIRIVVERPDMGEIGNPVELLVMVGDANDNRPTFPQTHYQAVVKELAARGTEILTVQAADNDDPKTDNVRISYRLVAQVPERPRALFLVDRDSGVISLQGDSLEGAALQYTLTVVAEDAKGLNSSCTVVVNVLDENNHPPVFPQREYGPFHLSEDSCIGATVTTLSAWDGDQIGKDSWRVDYELESGDAREVFALVGDEATNEVSLILQKALDYEDVRQYTLVLSARNPEPLVRAEYGPASTATVSIIVDDINESPTLPESHYEVSVREGEEPGRVIATIQGADPDSHPIRYSLRGDTKGYFSIDANTGELRAAQPLDREENSTYTMELVAEDGMNSSLSASALVTVYILDINDNSPVLVGDYSWKYLCTPRWEDQALLLASRDSDGPQHGGRLNFSLGSDPAVRRNWKLTPVNDTHTNLSMNTPYLAPEVYTIPFTISDSSTPPRSTFINLPVTVCPCNTRGNCRTAAKQLQGMPTIQSTLGILLGTAGVIGIVLIVVFVRLPYQNPKQQSTSKQETSPLKSSA
ncbi:cadherin-16 [Arapaima gigas]